MYLIARTLIQFTTHLPQSVLKTSNAILKSVTMDTCASACTSEQAFDCQSFSYCITTGKCSLSVIQPAESPNQVASNPFCDLYAREFKLTLLQLQCQFLGVSLIVCCIIIYGLFLFALVICLLLLIFPNLQRQFF